MRRAKEANTGFKREGEREIGGRRESGVVRERKRRAGREVGAERERKVGRVAGGDAGEEREAEDCDRDFGS